MYNEPNQSQWNQWPSSQYSQPQSGQWGQWGQQQPPTQYNPQQNAQPQYNANAQYYAQYGVPPVPQYAQVQPQQQADSLLMGWLMTRVIVRIVFIVLPLLLCGGCALFAVLSSLAR